jgi:hypothetical protein
MELLDFLGCLGDLDVEQTITMRIPSPSGAMQKH